MWLVNFLFRIKFKSRWGKIILWGHNHFYSVEGWQMTIPFIWKRKILDRGKSVSEDHSLDRQELVPVVRMVTSLSAYLYIFLIAFYLPPWNSFLKSHWNRDESQVKGLTLFCTFQCRYFRNYKIPTFKNYERNWQFSIHWQLQKGTYRRGHSKSSHAWKEIALRLFNSGGTSQCTWQKCHVCACMHVHINVCVDRGMFKWDWTYVDPSNYANQMVSLQAVWKHSENILAGNQTPKRCACFISGSKLQLKCFSPC